MLTVIVFMGSKVNGKTPSLFGYSVLRVSTGSMQPELMIGDVILGKSVDNPTALKVGDIITYRGSGQTEGLLVTHKVVVAPYKTADGVQPGRRKSKFSVLDLWEDSYFQAFRAPTDKKRSPAWSALPDLPG